MFDVCTTGDTAHIDTIFKFLPHTRQHECIDILYFCNDPCLLGTHVDACGQELEYRIRVCRVTRGAHMEHL
jgi:hypothetical protein